MFDPSAEDDLDAANEWRGMPLGVLEAYAFYSLYVMGEDWGPVAAHRVDAAGMSTVATWTCDDGGLGWLEVYGEEDGTLQLSSRTSF